MKEYLPWEERRPGERARGKAGLNKHTGGGLKKR